MKSKRKPDAEDLRLSRILLDAKRKEGNVPAISLAEVKKRLGLSPRRTRNA